MILDLDRKIRDFPVPKYLQPNCNELENPTVTPHLVMQRWIILSFKESSKSEYEIRRRFFLLTDDPNYQLYLICIGLTLRRHCTISRRIS
jgi:hypothetical protein